MTTRLLNVKSIEGIFMANKVILTEDSVINFGKKYYGRKVGLLIKENPGYLLWLHENYCCAELSPEVLAKCYDAKPPVSFEFNLNDIKDHRRRLDELLGSREHMLPAARYAVELLEYLETSLAIKPSLVIQRATN